jgi:polysaccharide export outer membrane protein
MFPHVKYYKRSHNTKVFEAAAALWWSLGRFDVKRFIEQRRIGVLGRGPFLVLLMAAVANFFIACQGPHKVVLPNQAIAHPSVVLGAGDIVRITFPGAPELNQAQKIRPDGKIGLPLIGEVDATGKSLSVLQDDLARLYKPKLQNSTVVLSLELTSAAIYISGAVNKPGKFMLERPMTALEAIMEAGGFTPGLANPKKVILVRQEGGQHRTQILDLSPAFRNEPTSAIYLKPYDVLVIPERMF